MASRNIFKGLLNPEFNPGRNAFDLSHRKVFTAKAGELLPILVEDMLPGDYFEIDTAALMRSFPLQTAAFLRARFCFDFFFVPKTAIWSQWKNYISQRWDQRSSLYGSFNYEPNVRLGMLTTLTQLSTTSAIQDSIDARRKLLQLLGYGLSPYRSSYPSGVVNPGIGNHALTALPIAGYNFIYNFFYRDRWKDGIESMSASDAQNTIRSFNMDYLTCDTFANSLVDQSANPLFVQMHYHQYPKDLFMGALPNSQFGVVTSIASGFIQPTVTTANLNPVSTAALSTSSAGKLRASSTLTNGAAPATWASSVVGLNLDGSGLDVLALRRALALQKWKEYNMRAGWQSSKQQKAMYGVPMPHDSLHELDYIDSFESPFMVDEVIATSTNGATASNPNGNLGELAGKGIGVCNGKTIKYRAQTEGYFYCIFYILPQVEYDAYGIDRQLIRSTPFDHYNPAYENIGLQPVEAMQLTTDAILPHAVLGYAPYGYEYKTRVDKVYGEFAYGKTLSSWVSTRRDLAATFDSSISSEIAKSQLYVSPAVLNTIFLMSQDGTFNTEQFMINCNFKFNAVRPMSVLGLPEL